jgi:uncharacterized protein DUF998
MVRKGLLLCGILAALLRIATDILAGLWYPGYSFLDQSMSQLAANGAPTRPFQLFLLAVDGVLLLAFGIGVFGAAGQKRSLRSTGMLLVSFAALGLAQQLIPSWSMQLEGGGSANTMHILITLAFILLIILFIGCGAASQGKSFRLYSIVTIIMLLVFGALAGLQAPKAVHFAAPWLGALERVSYYAYVLWVLVLAIVLWRAQATAPPGQPPASIGAPQLTPR